MARRRSNRDRIARMAEEAEAARREKPTGGLRAVWAVKNGRGEIVAVYPYSNKDAAEAEARRLKEETSRDHIVAPHKEAY